MKILANDGISASGVNALEAAGFEVILEKVAQDDLIDFINKEQVVGVLVRSATTVRQNVVDSCPNPKLIGRGGVGMIILMLLMLEKKDQRVINTPGLLRNLLQNWSWDICLRYRDSCMPPTKTWKLASLLS